MVGTLKETLDTEKNSSVFQYVEVIWNFLHELQTQGRKGPLSCTRKTAPGGLFCMSGPVAHADDDEEADARPNTRPVQKTALDDGVFLSEKAHSVVRKELDQLCSERPVPNVNASVEPLKQEHVVTCLWSDGCLYEGEWGSGQRTGRGKIFWPSGSLYEGEVMGGYLHGIGVYTGADGTSYRGSWVWNKKQGYGEKQYANGDAYQGFWKWDVPDGHGKYSWSNGSEYEGDWRGGMMCGHGVLSWANGDKYDGQWLNGLAEGPGVYSWADDSMYVGTWSRGMRCGEGKFCFGSKYIEVRSSPISCLDSEHYGYARDDKSYEASPRQKVSSPSDLPHELRMLTHGLPTNIEMLLLALENDHEAKLLLDRLWRVDGPANYLPGFDEEVHADTYAHDDDVSRESREVFMIPVSASEFSRHRWSIKEPKRAGELIGRGHKNFELMLNLQLGIRYSVGKITPEQKRKLFPSDFGARATLRMNFPREGSALTPPHQSADFKWKDYCPLVFRHLRELFKVDAADYMLSICGNEGLREFSSPGKSGSVFYLSQDERFMIKTLRKAEVKVLRRMLPRYHKHVRMYKSTLLTKFFGLYRIKIAGGQKVRFVVMGNIVSTESWIHRLYDLKGSSQGRFADKVESDDNTTLKDLDLDFEFHLDPLMRESVLEQISRDCKFLESERIMDYSLLLGLHFKSSQASRKARYQGSSPIVDLPLHDVVISRFVPNEGGFVEVEMTSKCSASTSPNEEHYDPAKWISRWGKEAKPSFSTNERHSMQLGACMPAIACHRPQNSTEVINAGESYDVVLYFGIIDILQEYDVGKKLEHAYKSFHFDALSISAVDPALYSRRFQHFMHQIFLKAK